MFRPTDHHTIFWLALVLVIAVVLGRVLWVYRGYRDWATSDGTITSLDVQQRRDADGHYTSAIFSYEFRDLEGHRKTGTWHKNFSTELEARDFASRELPIGKQVLVRFNPKDPAFNVLELDPSTYTNDRPVSLGL